VSRKQKGRPLDGMLLLDKGEGLSSNAAVQRVKRLLDARKLGHTGTLDPMATGLLPLCLGEGTKLSAYMLDQDKRYEFSLRLGTTTTTADREGEVMEERPVPCLDENRIEAALTDLRGDIRQIPPMYSALKFQGRRLYDLARQGLEVERPPRPVTIHALRLLGFDQTSVDLEVHCSKGTYVRSLGVDLGDALGCGAHVTRLRRTAVGRFSIDQAVTLEALAEATDEQRKAWLLSLDEIAAELPAVAVDETSATRLRHGQRVLCPGLAAARAVRLYDGAEFLGIGEISEDGCVAPRRMLAQMEAISLDGARV
jgi:tRNA pseudouridine55 synthase